MIIAFKAKGCQIVITFWLSHFLMSKVASVDVEDGILEMNHRNRESQVET